MIHLCGKVVRFPRFGDDDHMGIVPWVDAMSKACHEDGGKMGVGH